jgi:hypothetical protein
MSEPTISTRTEIADSLTIETHPDTHHIDRVSKAERGVVASIKKTVEKVVEKIAG